MNELEAVTVGDRDQQLLGKRAHTLNREAEVVVALDEFKERAAERFKHNEQVVRAAMLRLKVTVQAHAIGAATVGARFQPLENFDLCLFAD